MRRLERNPGAVPLGPDRDGVHGQVARREADLHDSATRSSSNRAARASWPPTCSPAAPARRPVPTHRRRPAWRDGPEPGADVHDEGTDGTHRHDRDGEQREHLALLLPQRAKQRCKPLLIANAFIPHAPLESVPHCPPPAHASSARTPIVAQPPPVHIPPPEGAYGGSLDRGKGDASAHQSGVARGPFARWEAESRCDSRDARSRSFHPLPVAAERCRVPVRRRRVVRLEGSTPLSYPRPRPRARSTERATQIASRLLGRAPAGRHRLAPCRASCGCA